MDPIGYTDTVFDEVTNGWVSRVEVADVPCITFPSDKAPGRGPAGTCPQAGSPPTPPGRCQAAVSARDANSP